MASSKARNMIGSELSDLNLTSIREDPGAADALRSEVVRNKVVLLRRQFVSPGELLDVAKSLGDPLVHADTSGRLPDFDEIYVVTNRDRRTGEVKPGSSRGSSYWHVDDAYHTAPQSITLLLGVECPAGSLATRYQDLGAAYRELAPQVRERICAYRAEHSQLGGRHRSSGWENGVGSPSTTHPLVRVHPESGERSLFLSPAHTSRIHGPEDSEDDLLLEELLTHLERRGHDFEHVCEEGDILIWDNRSVMHIGGGGGEAARTMFRIALQGDEPIGVHP